MKVTLLAKCDHFLGDRSKRLGLTEGGADCAVLDQAASHIGEQ
jgi:hypothetical protein